MKIVVGGQIDKQKVYDTIKGVVGDRASVEIKDDIAAAMAVKTGQADYYFGACKTGGRMGLVGNFIGFLLFAEETLDLLDTLGIGSGDHLRHFNDPVPLQLAVHVVVVQPTQVI